MGIKSRFNSRKHKQQLKRITKAIQDLNSEINKEIEILKKTQAEIKMERKKILNKPVRKGPPIE